MSLPRNISIAFITKFTLIPLLILFSLVIFKSDVSAHEVTTFTPNSDSQYLDCLNQSGHSFKIESKGLLTPRYICYESSPPGSGIGPGSGGFNTVTDPLSPTGSGTTVGQYISDLLPFVFGIAGMLTLLLLLWGGIKYMMARGDPKAVDEAKGTLTSAIIGLIIILLGAAIFYLVGTSAFKIDIFSNLPFATPVYAQEPVDIGSDFPLATIFPTAGSFFTNIVNLALAVAAIVFLAMIVWGGFRYLNSGGNQDEVEAARNTLAGAFIGLLIVVTAFVIIVIIVKATPVNLDIFG